MKRKRRPIAPHWEAFIKACERIANRSDESDSNTLFGKFVGARLREMPPHLRDRCILGITEVLLAERFTRPTEFEVPSSTDLDSTEQFEARTQ
jgi:hypothetical protein